ncbi:hypothetical protein FH972_015328 [Carpinus fangiana]|uniref:Uncharacterized protein n=1 Tax=Carpinus fangiana TaxID=176857 RepID=A0A5N6RDI3_9ROSI|nr:hypothetical protein FH972_015328 [Carpinus fangiana]
MHVTESVSAQGVGQANPDIGSFWRFLDGRSFSSGPPLAFSAPKAVDLTFQSRSSVASTMPGLYIIAERRSATAIRRIAISLVVCIPFSTIAQRYCRSLVAPESHEPLSLVARKEGRLSGLCPQNMLP